MSKNLNESEKLQLWFNTYGADSYNTLSGRGTGNIIVDYMRMIASQLFTYDFADTKLTRRVIENNLIKYGTCVAFRHKDGYAFLPYNRGTSLDINGDPQSVTPFTAYGDKKTLLTAVNVGTTGVIIRNNDLEVPTAHYIKYWGYLMTNALISLDLNLYTTRTPFIIKVDTVKRVTSAILKDKIKSGEMTIIEDPESSTPIEVLNFTGAYCGDRIFDLFIACQNILLQMLGINNSNTDKKERLIVDEVNANNQLVGLSFDAMYQSRLEGVAEFNRAFGTDIKVMPNPKLIPPQPQENDIGGEDNAL